MEKVTFPFTGKRDAERLHLTSLCQGVLTNGDPIDEKWGTGTGGGGGDVGGGANLDMGG